MVGIIVIGIIFTVLLALYSAATNDEAKTTWEHIYSAVLFTYGHHCLTRRAMDNGNTVRVLTGVALSR